MPTQTQTNIATTVGLAGIACALLLVALGDTRDLSHVWGNECVVVALAGPSAWVAGLVVSGGLGHRGAGGVVTSYLAGALATLLGAMIAGTFLAPGLGTLFAPTILFLNFINAPLLGFGWIICIAALHHAALKLRASMVNDK